MNTHEQDYEEEDEVCIISSDSEDERCHGSHGPAKVGGDQKDMLDVQGDNTTWLPIGSATTGPTQEQKIKLQQDLESYAHGQTTVMTVAKKVLSLWRSPQDAQHFITKMRNHYKANALYSKNAEVKARA